MDLSLVFRLGDLWGGNEEINLSYYVFVIHWCVYSVFTAVVFAIAASRVRLGPWRLFLLACAGVHALSFTLPCMGSGLGAQQALMYAFALPSAILIWAVWSDARRGVRYPWTHWLGVLVNVSFALVNLAMAVTMTVFPNT